MPFTEEDKIFINNLWRLQ